MSVHHSQYEILLSKHLKCKPSNISRRRSYHCGMVVLERRGYEYAVGAPGFTENYYGPEIKLHETVSAYRLTPGGVDEPVANLQTPPDKTCFDATKAVTPNLDFTGFEAQLAIQLRATGTGRLSCTEPNLSNTPKKGPETDEVNPYAQWTTTCPKCKTEGALVVKEVTLCETGKRHRPNTPLTSEGFDVNCDPDLKDQSTEDEDIVCTACGTCFDLGGLALPEKGTQCPSETES